MSLNNARPGIHFVPEYQSSGLPAVFSGSVSTTPQVVEFDMVTRAITVTNNSAATNFLLVGYSSNGVQFGTNSFPLNGGNSIRMEVRVKDLWLKSQTGTVNYGIMAELTTIERSKMPYLTGSLSAADPARSGSYVYNGVG